MVSVNQILSHYKVCCYCCCFLTDPNERNILIKLLGLNFIPWKFFLPTVMVTSGSRELESFTGKARTLCPCQHHPIQTHWPASPIILALNAFIIHYESGDNPTSLQAGAQATLLERGVNLLARKLGAPSITCKLAQRLNDLNPLIYIYILYSFNIHLHLIRSLRLNSVRVRLSLQSSRIILWSI